jgi:hypothetical protein
MLYHIYPQPAILDDCSQEISKVVTISQIAESNGILRSLDITALKTNCPILGSTFQEVLWHHTIGTSIRQVLYDIFIENRYLLK